MKAFIKSQIGCFLLIWMFHGRELNNKIIITHDIALTIACYDKSLTFKELLDKDYQTYLRCVLDECLTGESMAMQACTKITSKLMFLYEKTAPVKNT